MIMAATTTLPFFDASSLKSTDDSPSRQASSEPTTSPRRSRSMPRTSEPVTKIGESRFATP